MFLCFLSSGENGMNKSPNPFRRNLYRIQERLGFLFLFHIFFVYCFDPIFEPPIDFLEECRKHWETAQSSFRKTIERKIGNTWYVIETECDGNEPLADKVKRLIFSDKGVIC